MLQKYAADECSMIKNNALGLKLKLTSKMQKFVNLILFFSILSCTHTYLEQNTPDPLHQKSTTAENIVAAGHPLASEAGIQMLKEGGNAFDAAVAASFAISVLRPQSSGLGGGGFALLYDKKDGAIHAYDFRERAPELSDKNMFLNKDGSLKNFYYTSKNAGAASANGHLSVGVPGLVAGLLEIHKKFGKLSLKKVMEPAITFADQGFPMYSSLSKYIDEKKDLLILFPETRKIFLPNGEIPTPGQLFIQKELAESLRLISKHGEKAFYTGEIADALIEEMKVGAGILKKKDLEDYKVIKREAIGTEYRTYKIFGMPPPSSGGVHIIEILNMISSDDVASLKHNSVPYLHLLTEAMRRAFADRAMYLGDPDFYKIPIKGLLSKEYAHKLRNSIDLNKASSSSSITAGNPLPYESPSTTHISVVDSSGNAVSTTQTINGIFGSGVTVRGIVLNNEMEDFATKPGSPNIFGLTGGEGNSIAPRKTMLSSMSPTLVFNKNGELTWILGSPGGPRIITATLQTLINVIDFQLPLTDAVQATRIHHQWLPDEISIESDLSKDVRKGLEKLGHKLKIRTPSHTWTFGDVEAIGRLSNGKWIGVSDKRSDGIPKGYSSL